MPLSALIPAPVKTTKRFFILYQFGRDHKGRAFGFIFLAKKPKKDIASIPHANSVNIHDLVSIAREQSLK
jgi:hypothetical protein